MKKSLIMLLLALIFAVIACSSLQPAMPTPIYVEVPLPSAATTTPTADEDFPPIAEVDYDPTDIFSVEEHLTVSILKDDTLKVSTYISLDSLPSVQPYGTEFFPGSSGFDTPLEVAEFIVDLKNQMLASTGYFYCQGIDPSYGNDGKATIIYGNAPSDLLFNDQGNLSPYVVFGFWKNESGEYKLAYITQIPQSESQDFTNLPLCSYNPSK